MPSPHRSGAWTAVPIHGDLIGSLDEVEAHLEIFSITVERGLRVVTERTIWLFRPSSYLRLPLMEAPRRPLVSIDDALTDGRWLAFNALSVRRFHDGEQVWILPAGRDPNARGIHTGLVVSADPKLDDLRSDRDS